MQWPLFEQKPVSVRSSIRVPPPRQAARQLLTLDQKDPKRLFEGPALLRRMTRFGLLGEDEKELDFVLQLTTEKMLERRLQTKVSFLRCVFGVDWPVWGGIRLSFMCVLACCGWT